MTTVDQDIAALVEVEDGAVDPYEREFMTGDGTVLYRAKARAHWSLAALMFGGATIATVGIWSAAGILGGAMAFLTFAFAWLLFTVLRVTVSSGSLNIQLGLSGPTISIAAIDKAEATTYRFSQFGGWGTRRTRDGVMYNMPGDGGNALRVEWHTESGDPRVTWVGTRQAPALVDAIREAKRVALAGRPPAELPPGD